MDMVGRQKKGGKGQHHLKKTNEYHYVVCGSTGSAELTLHHIFTLSKLFFYSGKIGPGKSDKHM